MSKVDATTKDRDKIAKRKPDSKSVASCNIHTLTDGGFLYILSFFPEENEGKKEKGKERER